MTQCSPHNAAADGAVGHGPLSPEIIVGIGASAGGLTPLRTLLSGLPVGRGLAVVILRHIRAESDELLVPLLAAHTQLKVVGATDGVIEAEHAYILPADKSLSVIEGRLLLRDVSQCEGLFMPIDHFFCTLAADQGRRAVGVVLSGMGIDGTHGLAEIKAMGGTTAAQDPRTAEFPEMPQNAINAGYADAVLPPEKFAEHLVRQADEMAALTVQQQEEAGLEAVLVAVRNATGHDFHCFKRATLERRIRRRMTLQKCGHIDDYARLLRTSRDEAATMRKDLLIGVTEFFRQAEAWRVLDQKVVANMIAAAKPPATLRVWVPACATGKEPYSLAMLLIEGIEKSGKQLGLQLFATDTDASAVEIARAGRFAEEELKGVSPSRLRRFFVQKNGRYEVVKQLRELIVFAPQDLTSDPPFSKLDLVSCRNLLIYLDQTVQKKIIQLFHFALRDGGYLFLGSAETISNQENLFEPVSLKWRLYRKLGVTTPVGLDLPLRPTIKPAIFVPSASVQSRATLPTIADHAIAERFGPPAAVVVDRKGTLLYLHGQVGDFLEHTAGEHTGLLADAAREGLRNRLASAILQAGSENKKVTVQARIKKDRKTIPLRVSVSPLRQPREADGLLLVTFEPQKPARTVRAAEGGETPATALREVEDELQDTREELSSTIEQLQQSNEHLKASNEEVTSANEELQSANEELETSKEELQSLNEELNAVNQRLQEKVAELEQAGNDVDNLLTSGSIASLFLDRQLRVRRFTPAVTRLLSLIDTDLGRPLADLTRKFKDDTLLDDARRVLVDLSPISAEIQADDGCCWYIRRILPYRTKEDRIEGVVITFAEVTELKHLVEELCKSEEAVKQNQKTFAELIERAPFGIYMVDSGFRIAQMNTGSQEGAFRNARPVIGRDFSEAMRILWPESVAVEIIGHFRHTLETGEPYYSPRFTHPRHDAEIVESYEWELHRLTLPDGQHGVICYYFDSTKLREAEAALREERDRLTALISSISDEVWFADAVGQFTLVNPSGSREFNLEPEATTEVRQLAASLEVLRPDGTPRPIEEAPPLRALRGEVVTNQDEWLRTHATGELRYRQVSAAPVRDHSGRIIGSVSVVRDITDLKQAEAAVRESEERFRTMADAMPQLAWIARPDGHIVWYNQRWYQYTGTTPEQMEGWGWQSVHDPVELPGVLEQWKTSLATGEPFEMTFPLRGADGVFRLFLTRGFPLKDAAGRVAQWFGTNTDVDELKRAEDALRAKEADLIEAQRVARIGSWYWDAKTDVTTGSDELLRIYGFDPATQTMPDFKEQRGRCYPEEDWERVNAAVQSTMETGVGYELDVRALRNGNMIWVTTRGEVVRDATGQLVGLRGTMQDITERKQAEEALREAEREKSLILDNTSEIIAYHDNDNNLIWANNAYLNATGLPLSELKGRKCYLNWGLEQKCKHCPVVTAIQTGEPQEAELTHENQPHWPADQGSWLVRAAPVKDNTGNIIGAIEVAHDITASKQAEEAFQQAYGRLKTFFDRRIGGIGIIIARADGSILQANDYYLDILGHTRQEFEAGQVKWIDRTPPEWLPADERALAQLREHGACNPYEKEYVRRDGTRVPVLITDVMMPGEEKDILAIIVNMTERKQAEERERKEHERAIFANRVLSVFVEYEGDELFNQALAIVQECMASPHGVFGYISAPGHLTCPSLSKMLDECEVVGKCIHYPPEKWNGLWARALKEKLSFFTNLAPRVPQGHPIINCNLAVPILYYGEAIGLLNLANKEGGYTEEDRKTMDALASRIAPVLFAWIQRKLREDERRRNEEALRESEERLRVAQQAARLGSFEWNIQSGLNLWSPEMEAMYGLRPGEFAQTQPAWEQLVHPEDRPSAQRLVEESFQTGEPTEGEWRVVWPDGSMHWLAGRWQFFKDAGGQALRLVGVNMDITERKQAERNILRLNEILAVRNQELRDMNQELEAFTYSVSHDLRAPIRHVSGFAELLAEDYADKLGDEGLHSISRIRVGTEKATRLIDDLLRFSRISRQNMQNTEIDLSGKALEVIAELREASPDRNVRIRVEPQLTATADPSLLGMVLANLLENAWKFTSNTDQAAIEFGATHQEEKTVYFVKDNGAGFDPAYAKKMFRPFQRLHSEKEFKGTGIGLAIVERIIHRHGGKVWAEGEVGNGATVYFTLG